MWWLEITYYMSILNISSFWANIQKWEYVIHATIMIKIKNKCQCANGTESSERDQCIHAQKGENII